MADGPGARPPLLRVKRKRGLAPPAHICLAMPRAKAAKVHGQPSMALPARRDESRGPLSAEDGVGPAWGVWKRVVVGQQGAEAADAPEGCSGTPQVWHAPVMPQRIRNMRLDESGTRAQSLDLPLDSFHLVDAEIVRTHSSAKSAGIHVPSKEQEETILETGHLSSQFMSLLQEHLPGAAHELEASEANPSSEDGFTYDYYQPDVSQQLQNEHDLSFPFVYLVDDESADEEAGWALDNDSEDSNDESHARNAYADYSEDDLSSEGP
eukprot:SM000426S15721  [mRNA]  locus=s426:1457:3627:- [translate_table: standard]